MQSSHVEVVEMHHQIATSVGLILLVLACISFVAARQESTSTSTPKSNHTHTLHPTSAKLTETWVFDCQHKFIFELPEVKTAEGTIIKDFAEKCPRCRENSGEGPTPVQQMNDCEQQLWDSWMTVIPNIRQKIQAWQTMEDGSNTDATKEHEKWLIKMTNEYAGLMRLLHRIHQKIGLCGTEMYHFSDGLQRSLESFEKNIALMLELRTILSNLSEYPDTHYKKLAVFKMKLHAFKVRHKDVFESFQEMEKELWRHGQEFREIVQGIVEPKANDS